MKFKYGTEWFRKATHKAKKHFKKGKAFVGGTKFPLVKGKIGKEPEEDNLNYFYSADENED